MPNVRIVFDKVQEHQPQDANERGLADHDLRFLLEYLSASRRGRYKLVARPDEQRKDTPAPDYLLSDAETGRTLVVERTQLMWEHLQAAKARLIREGADVVIVQFGTIDPRHVQQALRECVARKARRGQLTLARADERILLVRNRLGPVGLLTFLRLGDLFTPDERAFADHAYLIVFRHLLEMW